MPRPWRARGRLRRESGVRIIHHERAVFSGESIVVLGEYVGESLPSKGPDCRESDLAKAATFRDRWPDYRAALHRFLEGERSAVGKIYVYGAGCRACSLINFTGIGTLLDAVLDDQPEKQGKLMPGSHLPILPGSVLDHDPPGLCLLAVNAENEDKVIGRHPGFERQGGRFFSLPPPTDRLIPSIATLVGHGIPRD